MPESQFKVTTHAQLKALAHPVRQQMFEQFATEPATTKQVAVRLGLKPTRLYHHAAILEKAGLIRLVSKRQNRGTTENYYAAVATRLEIDAALLGGADSDAPSAATGIAVIDGVLDNVRNDFATLLSAGRLGDDENQSEAMFAQIKVSTASTRGDEIRSKVEQFVQELERDYSDSADSNDSQSSFRMLIGLYPSPD